MKSKEYWIERIERNCPDPTKIIIGTRADIVRIIEEIYRE